MPRIDPTPGTGVLLTRVLGRCPEILGAVLELDDAIRVRGAVSRRLKEHVRRSTAELIGCRYCASLGEPVDTPGDRREALAIALARQMADDPSAVDDAQFAQLREAFSDEEIVELVAWIAYVVIGGQTFGAVMNLEPAAPGEAEWYQRAVVER